MVRAKLDLQWLFAEADLRVSPDTYSLAEALEDRGATDEEAQAILGAHGRQFIGQDPKTIKVTGSSKLVRQTGDASVRAVIRLYTGHSAYDVLHEMAHAWYNLMGREWQAETNQLLAEYREHRNGEPEGDQAETYCRSHILLT